jgi:hypothetical protein
LISIKNYNKFIKLAGGLNQRNTDAKIIVRDVLSIIFQGLLGWIYGWLGWFDENY